MILHKIMLVEAAEKAGMKAPDDVENFEPEEFPHFHVFCLLQLARPVVYHGEHWENARLIASIPEDELKKMTLQDFLARGLSFAN